MRFSATNFGLKNPIPFNPSFPTTPVAKANYPKYIVPFHPKRTLKTQFQRNQKSGYFVNSVKQSNTTSRPSNGYDFTPSKTAHGSLLMGQILKLLKVWSPSMRFYATKSKT